MPPKKTKSVEAIIRKEMPGFRVARRKFVADSDAPAAPEAVSPDLAYLREKHRGKTDARNAANPGDLRGPARDAAHEEDDLAIVNVEPEDADARPGARRSAVVVSKKQGKIIGFRG